MSGSNSSLPGAAPAQPAEPLELSVHALPAPEGLVAGERTQRGRWMMAFVVLLCALPVVASYFTFYVLQPRGQAFGDLIHPARDLPATLPLRTLDGSPLAAGSLKGQWLLVVVDGGSCVADCEPHLFMQRQLREMLGRERERLDKVWLIADDAPVAPQLRKSLEATPGMTLLRTDATALAAWLQPATGHGLGQHLYLVDPMGRWMWRSPAQPGKEDAQKIKRVIDKLLRASGSWDKAGRP